MRAWARWAVIGLMAAAPAAWGAEEQPAKDADWQTCPIPTNEELRAQLGEERYKVVRESGTEAPFLNPYWNNKRPGLYVDVVTGEPLFTSIDKFESKSGWPSFTKPLAPDRVTTRTDASHGMARTEVRAGRSDAHLGHLFDDGPAPTNRRYCINSASLRFIPVEDLEKEGYGEYLPLFQ